MNEAGSQQGRFGFVALVGRANVGKSTLLNRLVGEKVAIVSAVAQTTRNRILGVATEERGQVAFLDSPGFHKPQHRLGEILVETARAVADEADLILWLVDASEGIGPGDRHVLELLKPRESRAPVILVLNKVDLMNKGRLLPLIEQGVKEWGCAEAVPVSAESGENCERLLDVIFERLPAGPPHYPPDYLTDQGERRFVSELIREKLLGHLRQEVPHSIAVLVEELDEREDGLVEIAASVLVERESQKGIVIGARGARLKDVGTQARRELEKRWGRKVFLKLWVRVRENWRERVSVLRDLGVYPG